MLPPLTNASAQFKCDDHPYRGVNSVAARQPVDGGFAGFAQTVERDFG